MSSLIINQSSDNQIQFELFLGTYRLGFCVFVLFSLLPSDLRDERNWHKYWLECQLLPKADPFLLSHFSTVGVWTQKITFFLQRNWAKIALQIVETAKSCQKWKKNHQKSMFSYRFLNIPQFGLNISAPKPSKYC